MPATLVPDFTETDTGRYVNADTRVDFPVVAFTEHGPIVRTRRTRTLGLVTQTGHKLDRGGRIRVRVTLAIDLGTADGSISFDGDTVGGYAPATIFQGR